MNSWNYEELGFRSQQELDESIKRVKADPKNDLELRAENRAKFESINKNGGVDFNALNEGVRLSELDRVVASKLYWEREAEKQKEAQEEVNDLMSKVADTITDEAKEEAEKELRKQKAKAEAELEKQIYSKHNVLSNKEVEENQLLGNMLKDLKL